MPLARIAPAADAAAAITAAVAGEATFRTDQDTVHTARLDVMDADRVQVVQYGTDLAKPRPANAIMVEWLGEGGYPTAAVYPDRGYRTDTNTPWYVEYVAPPGLPQIGVRYRSDSIWRIGVATGVATYGDPVSDPATAQIIALGAANSAWINKGSYSIPAYSAETTDPVAHTTDRTTSSREGYEYVPLNAAPAVGLDANCVIIQPGKRTSVDLYKFTRTDDTNNIVSVRELADLDGAGTGPMGGIRAGDFSTLAGLMLGEEIDPAHPFYTGVIAHALVIALDGTSLYKTPGATGGWTRDRHGFVTNTAGSRSIGYVWPATAQDANWNSSTSPYSGNIPMGTMFAIPAGVNLATLGLETALGMQMAVAAQNYGVIVGDRTVGSTAFYADPISAAAAPTSACNSSGDPNRVLSALRRVTNNIPATPGGAVVGATRLPGTPAARSNGGVPIWKFDPAVAVMDAVGAPALPKTQFHPTAYELSAGGTASIVASRARFKGSTSTSLGSHWFLDMPRIDNFEWRGVLRFPTSVASMTARFGIRANPATTTATDGSPDNGYAVLFAPNLRTCAIQKEVFAAGTAIGVSVEMFPEVLSIGDTVNYRLQVESAYMHATTTIRAKFWKVGTTEPGTWTKSETDASTPYVAGKCCFGVGSSTTGTSADIELESSVIHAIGETIP